MAPKIKGSILSSEVHWQVAGWNTIGIPGQYTHTPAPLGSEAEIFAPVYVTHGGILLV